MTDRVLGRAKFDEQLLDVVELTLRNGAIIATCRSAPHVGAPFDLNARGDRALFGLDGTLIFSDNAAGYEPVHVHEHDTITLTWRMEVIGRRSQGWTRR